eukprot:gene5140-34948_t
MLAYVLLQCIHAHLGAGPRAHGLAGSESELAAAANIARSAAKTIQVVSDMLALAKPCVYSSTAARAPTKLNAALADLLTLLTGCLAAWAVSQQCQHGMRGSKDKEMVASPRPPLGLDISPPSGKRGPLNTPTGSPAEGSFMQVAAKENQQEAGCSSSQAIAELCYHCMSLSQAMGPIGGLTMMLQPTSTSVECIPSLPFSHPSIYCLPYPFVPTTSTAYEIVSYSATSTSGGVHPIFALLSPKHLLFAVSIRAYNKYCHMKSSHTQPTSTSGGVHPIFALLSPKHLLFAVSIRAYNKYCHMKSSHTQPTSTSGGVHPIFALLSPKHLLFAVSIRAYNKYCHMKSSHTQPTSTSGGVHPIFALLSPKHLLFAVSIRAYNKYCHMKSSHTQPTSTSGGVHPIFAFSHPSIYCLPYPFVPTTSTAI